MNNQPATARDIYNLTYRNARCMRSLDARAVPTRIFEPNPKVRQRVLEIAGLAQLSLLDRSEPVMAWFCITYENRFKARKAQLEQQRAVTVTEVVLERAEGPTALCGIPHKLPTLAEANGVLMAWAWGMPADQLGYDKVDFTVYFSNGDCYEGRFDLQVSHRLGANIQAQMVGHLQWVAANADYVGEKYAQAAKEALPFYRSL